MLIQSNPRRFAAFQKVKKQKIFMHTSFVVCFPFNCYWHKVPAGVLIMSLKDSSKPKLVEFVRIYSKTFVSCWWCWVRPGFHKCWCFFQFFLVGNSYVCLTCSRWCFNNESSSSVTCRNLKHFSFQMYQIVSNKSDWIEVVKKFPTQPTDWQTWFWYITMKTQS